MAVVRWLLGPRVTNSSSDTDEDAQRALPAAATDSWRTWVMTGARKAPIDRRRLRGDHRGLKKMLVEGINGGEHPQPWKDFSGAMIRQSVDEAVNSLPPEQKQVVKLAYFGGLSNQEIASRLGISVAGVHRRLREALATVSSYVERGQTAGRRGFYSIGAWIAARSFLDHAHRASGPGTDHVVQAATAVAVGVVAAAALMSTPASPAALSSPFRSGSVNSSVLAAHEIAAPIETPKRTAVPAVNSLPAGAPTAAAPAASAQAPDAIELVGVRSEPAEEPLKVKHKVPKPSPAAPDLPDKPDASRVAGVDGDSVDGGDEVVAAVH